MDVRPTVLVIENDEAIQVLLDTMLSMQGYRVRSAYDGLGGLYEVGMLKPDLILLDIGLPIMDGETFIATYHQTPGPHAPIIGMSAYAVDARKIDGLAGFVPKPFTLPQLRNAMEVVLHGSARV